ncbi:MAG: zinc-binding alcohol dehydrogenase family protein [Candidatus Baltobacteraceae bacterium]
MKALQIDRFGPLDALEVRDVPDARLRDGEVRVHVEAAGVNPSDAGVALGRFPHVTLPRILGRDFAGTVVEGPAQSIGAKIWGSGGGELGMTRDGSHAEHLVLPASAAIRRPSHLSAQQAAVAGVPFVTAWSALVGLAGLKSGEWVLVSGAAGAVGSAAMQIVGALGGHGIGLVLEHDDITPLDGVKLEGIVHSDRDDVPNAVHALTGGRGVDVALNAVGAPIFAQLFYSLANDGRMVIFSARAGRDAALNLFDFYRRRLRMFGLDTAALDLGAIAAIYARLTPLFESRALVPSPIAASFPLSQAREAYVRVEGGAAGKVVLVPGG